MVEDEQAQSSPTVSAQQPGAVIAPGAPTEAPQPPKTAPTALPPTPAAQPNSGPVPQTPFEAATDPYQPQTAAQQETGAISWTASEFIAHEKSPGWYLALAGVAALIAVIIFLLTKDWVSTAVVVVGALALGTTASRRPRQLQYRLDDSGIHIGDKHYGYDDFRSFAVAQDGAFSSIVFMPLKRFAPFTNIYYAPEDEDKIVALLADQLPLEEHQADAVDRFMRRIRF